MDLSLDTPVQYVKGVGPTRAKQLAQLGVETLEDLLMYFPRRFDLRKQVQPIASLTGLEDGPVTVAGEIVSTRFQQFGARPRFEATIDDGSATIDIIWFHGGYLTNRLRTGAVISVNGKIREYRGQLQFTNPAFQVLYGAEGEKLDRDELLPVYPAGANLSSGVIGQVIQKVLPQAAGLLRPWFDRRYLADRGLPDRPSAIVAMHRPDDREHWAQARRRLAYEECFLMQLGIAMMRQRQTSQPAHPLRFTKEVDERIRRRFPFALTAAQDRAALEIAADLRKSRPMNRLLQGDVGAGKTVVALHAALVAVANGKQVAIMAPTEILARQHFAKIQAYLADSQVKAALLTGQMKQIDRSRILDGLATGSVNIAVGTHALLGEDVKFADLALVVVDEQHKFGVAQRTGIRGKGFAPHYLVMTATPIPRTLAMTVFGDLDISTIDELPPGRGTTTTKCVSMKDVDDVHAAVAERLDAGQQAYYIYPLVSASADLDLTAATDAYAELRDGPLGRYGVGLIHGQMGIDEKNRVMADFRDGRIKLLVASVVVEVGVDVPNAGVMAIFHAERFGLAQLHQLRGRIGRGKDDALCLLVASPNNPLARKRLEVLTQTSDGFKIAEEDLRIRGPGEIFGTQQHGMPDLKVADLAEDFELLRLARRDAFAMIEDDPDLAQPAHQTLRREMLKMYGGKLALVEGA